MTPRLRRLLVWGGAAVLLLFLGRWLVTLLAARWWAAAISPAAEASLTRWALLGLALDVIAVAVASAWFAAQGLLVARAIGSVQVERRIGNLTVREAIPTRLLLAGAVAIGVLLGTLTGVGARDWRAPLALAWEGVRYGVTDSFLGRDLGLLTVDYPVWHLAQRFATLLVLLGLVLSVALYLGIGAIRRAGSRLDIHLDAKRHLGALLALLALVIGAGYLLAPMRLATSAVAPVGDVAASARILAAHAAAGAALAVAAMSAAWAIRARHSLLVAGWTVFALAAMTERLVVPAFLAEGPAPTPPDREARQMAAVFWGLHLTEPAQEADSLAPATALWDEAALGRWAAARGARPLGAFQDGSGENPSWLVASLEDGEPPRLGVTLVAGGALALDGSPGIAGTPGPTSRVEVAGPRAFPGAPDWSPRRDGGVPLGGAPRRVALAWALQQPGILPLPAGGSIDWLLDPVARVAALVPPLDWSVEGLLELDGRLAWVLSGLATVERAPLLSRRVWRGRRVAGAVPALVGLVDAGSGGVRLWVDPAADSLGVAWGRIFGSLVEPAAGIPAELIDRLPYPLGWLEGQLRELEGPAWGLGVRPGQFTPEGPPRSAAPLWTAEGPARQALLEDATRGAPTTLVTARRADRQPVLELRPLLDEGRLGARALQQLWERDPLLTQLADSVRAGADTLLAGPIRWRERGERLLAWQVWWSAGRQGTPALLWIGTADGTRPGGARRPEGLWSEAGDSLATADRTAVETATRLEAMRGWMRRADSALARGDLTAFGRAWEALRSLLEAAPPR